VSNSDGCGFEICLALGRWSFVLRISKRLCICVVRMLVMEKLVSSHPQNYRKSVARRMLTTEGRMCQMFNN